MSTDTDSTEQTDAPPDDSRAARLGGGLQRLAWLPFKILLWFGMGFLSKMPKRTSVYRKMITKGYENLYRNTDGHFVVNTVYGDGAAVPRAAQFDSEEETVETNNGEDWTATAGVDTIRIGDAPVATAVADDHAMVDHISARIAEAADYSPRRWQTVDDSGEGYRPVDYQDPVAAVLESTDPGGQVRADGGPHPQGQAASLNRAIEEELNRLLPQQCTFSDIWLDASNPEEDNDGWIVSMEKAYELHWDQGSSEEMKKQEDRGRLAEMDPDQHKRQQLYYALIGLGGVALGLFGPALAQQIAGTAAESGGSAIPLLVGPLLGVI